MGPTYGTLQNAFPPAQRATAVAVLFLVLNLIALGFGPPLTELLIDHLGALHHANASATGVMPALFSLPWFDFSSFQRSCPSVVGIVAGSSADVACRTAVKFATRRPLS